MKCHVKDLQKASGGSYRTIPSNTRHRLEQQQRWLDWCGCWAAASCPGLQNSWCAVNELVGDTELESQIFMSKKRRCISEYFGSMIVKHAKKYADHFKGSIKGDGETRMTSTPALVCERKSADEADRQNTYWKARKEKDRHQSPSYSSQIQTLSH